MEYGSSYQWPWNDGVWGKAMTWSLILSSGNPSGSCVTNSLSAIPFICGVSVFKKKNGKTPAAKFEMCQNFWRPGFFWVWILCDGSSNKVQQPPEWNFTVFQPYPTSILPARATLKAEKQQGNPALAAQRISENLRVVPKIATPPARGSAKNHFPNYNNKSFQLGVILISGQTLLVELLGINHQQDRIKSGVYKGHPQNPETQLL